MTVRCQNCNSMRLVIPNRGRMLCLECSMAEIEQDGITITEVDRNGYAQNHTYGGTDPATGLRYGPIPRAWRYR